MKQFLSNRWFLVLLRGALATIFIYAGVIKMIAPQDFADSIATFRILPAFLLPIVALALPPFEVLVGGLFLAGRFKRQAAASIFILAIAFSTALLQAWVRKLDVDCGCFGSHRPGDWNSWGSLGRSLLILGFSGWLYYIFSKGMVKLPNNTTPIESGGFDSQSAELTSVGKYTKKTSNK